jgi:hypothetical protein
LRAPKLLSRKITLRYLLFLPAPGNTTTPWWKFSIFLPPSPGLPNMNFPHEAESQKSTFSRPFLLISLLILLDALKNKHSLHALNRSKGAAGKEVKILVLVAKSERKYDSTTLHI